MALQLYDTATRSLRPFEPIEPGRASIYLCGATVQAPPHIGHIRSGLNFDILARWLTRSGYDVTFIRNVTDIDDKILRKSAENDLPWWAWGARNERAFSESYTILGCLPPTYEPRATGHITEMIGLMQRLIDDGHAYESGGDVYYDVRSFPRYGALSHQRLDAMHPAADTDAEHSARKRDPRDFALWKSAKAGEPSWPTPWGNGRPGWHLECSAMATKYLGSTFDIHGGGIDLIFPHHENEIAQSEGAGDGFARYWVHNAWLTIGGEKMSKSLGNSLFVTEIVKHWRPVEVRYYLGAAHYRSHMEYSPDALDQAAAAYRRIEGFVERAADAVGEIVAGALPDAFVASMDDDLGVPAALGLVLSTVRDGNSALEGGNVDSVRAAAGQVIAMTEVLGISPTQWATSGHDDLSGTVDDLVRMAVDQRNAARKRKDFAAADAIRAQLAAAGVTVEDTPAGPRWTVK